MAATRTKASVGQKNSRKGRSYSVKNARKQSKKKKTLETLTTAAGKTCPRLRALSKGKRKRKEKGPHREDRNEKRWGGGGAKNDRKSESMGRQKAGKTQATLSKSAW